MAIFNEITKDEILEINSRLRMRRDGNHPVRSSSDTDSFIRFMNDGIKKIEASDTKNLMFARLDDR